MEKIWDNAWLCQGQLINYMYNNIPFKSKALHFTITKFHFNLKKRE